MSIQERIRNSGKALEWRNVRPFHTVLHTVDEMGVLAREALFTDSYKKGYGKMRGAVIELAILLYKPDSRLGAELEAETKRKICRNEERFIVKKYRSPKKAP